MLCSFLVYRKVIQLCVCVCMHVLSLFNRVWLFATPWIIAHQVPSAPEIFPARALDWVAMPSFRGSSNQGLNLCLLHCRWILYLLSCCGTHTHTHTHTYVYSFPLWFITGYWISFPVQYGMTLFIHSIYKSLLLLIPSSSPSLSHLVSPMATTNLFLCLWVCFYFIF